MPRLRWRPLLFAAALAAACTTLSTLDRPVFAIIEGDSVCSSTVAMDSHRQVWGESGCEASSSGWRHLRDATEAQQLRIIIAFADLPDAGSGCPSPDGGGAPADTRLRLRLLQSSSDSQWAVCGLPDGGLAPPFDEAVSAMRELGPPP